MVIRIMLPIKFNLISQFNSNFKMKKVEFFIKITKQQKGTKISENFKMFAFLDLIFWDDFLFHP